MAGRDVRVGIDEKENFAAGGARPGVARGGDLPALDRDDAGAELSRDLGGGVGRGVVDHDQFVGLLRPRRPRRAARCSVCRQLVFFVMRRDDEGNLWRRAGGER